MTVFRWKKAGDVGDLDKRHRADVALGGLVGATLRVERERLGVLGRKVEWVATMITATTAGESHASTMLCGRRTTLRDAKSLAQSVYEAHARAQLQALTTPDADALAAVRTSARKLSEARARGVSLKRQETFARRLTDLSHSAVERLGADVVCAEMMMATAALVVVYSPDGGETPDEKRALFVRAALERFDHALGELAALEATS